MSEEPYPKMHESNHYGMTSKKKGSQVPRLTRNQKFVNSKKMVSVIRNYDKDKVHSVTVCNVVNSEFSDGTGRFAGVRRNKPYNTHHN